MRTPILLSVLLVAASVAGCSSDAETTATPNEQDESLLHRGNVDTAAVVEATTIMLSGGPLSPSLDLYNRESPFAGHPADYAKTFALRLETFDAMDGTSDWTTTASTAWVRRVAGGNYLVLDTSKPCNYDAPHTYLEFERAHLRGRNHTTCGGRMPNEDALDVTMTFLVRGPGADPTGADAISDGVDEATQQATKAFPYLADVN